jgi:NAD(P)-dependent dehydrogenase (short-subunit alcohol dehydrogenase family)
VPLLDGTSQDAMSIGENAMINRSAFAFGRVAVITGGASGIGFAAAMKFASLGMRICIADVDGAALERAASEIRSELPGSDVLSVKTDVSQRQDVDHLSEKVYAEFGEVAVLMNNAGTEGGGQLFGDPNRWHRIIDVNLWGVINGVQAFVPRMLLQKTHCAIINTGSKQGITCPPGDTAYNVSKAGIKVVTEALAHELRNVDGALISPHLLIPGFTFTGFTRVHTQIKPEAAWTPEQVVDFMMEAIGRGEFYILCPDNSVTRDIDELRMRWAMDDIVENRPPLSRWHPDYRNAFQAFLDAGRLKSNKSEN